ncbi:MAG: hypothetical protein HY819_24560 [Acidobacteria bacterium]|nr:hypothetical protein [Acidobacteriota bacterium]
MKFVQIFLLLFVILFSLETIFAANEKQKLNFKDLELELSTTKQEFLLLEPIQLTVKLKNKRGEAIMPNSSPELKQEDVQLRVSFEDKKIKLPELSNSIASLMSYEKILTSERKLQYQIIPRGEVFLSSGEYSLTLVFYKGKERLMSNSLAINVVKPLGMDKEVFDSLKSLPNFISLLDTPGVSEEANLTDKLEKLVRDFPQSVYTSYIIFNLAEIDFSLGNYNQAINKLVSLSNNEEFPFFEIVLQRLEEIYTNNNDSFMADYYRKKLNKRDLRNTIIMSF